MINRHPQGEVSTQECTGSLYHPEDTPGTHFCQRLSRPQGHSAAGKDQVNEKS